MQMARQVVRSELQTSATLVVDVTQEALSEVLLSARHITVKVHPEDLALIAHGCADAVEARGARLVADTHIERGGCLVESDLGVVDARLSTRWAGAVTAMGSPTLADVDQNDRPPTP
jgi:flagellar assembly protein FliH